MIQMPEKEDLQSRAVASYRNLLTAYEDIARQLDEPDAPAVQELADRIAAGLDEVKLYDERLSQAVPPPQRNSSLEQERRRLAQLIQRQYELLFPRIRGMIAMYHAELQQIRHGKAGMDGYHPERSPSGGRLNTSC